jgi:NAD(P)-dependent dehydrogenase (short-subunit alcohol dehydrogenase family)
MEGDRRGGVTTGEPDLDAIFGGTVLPSLARPTRAIVVGASGGIGGALVARLAAADFDTVHAWSRRGLSPEGAPRGVVAGALDLADEASIAAAVATLEGGAPPRLVMAATGLLHDRAVQPEKSMRALDADTLARAFAINTIGPALLAKHLIPKLPRAGKAVFAALSARVGSIEDNQIGGWYGYRASKAALNQMIRTLAIETRRARPEAIVVALHPGTVATGLSAPFRGSVGPDRLFTPDRAAAHLLAVIDRLTPEDSGGFFAWDGRRIPF